MSRPRLRPIVLGTLLCGLSWASAGCAAERGAAAPDASAAGAASAPPTQAAQPLDTSAPHPGARGIGDPYYPELGNGGYDVEHYELVLDVDPDSGVLQGQATIRAHALENLSSFDLDLFALDVDSVHVGGRVASFELEDHELVVTPQEPLRAGAAFEVAVAYGGVPEVVPDPAIPIIPGVGWWRTPSGVYVMSECTGAASWFPCNDHPLDKATFGITVSVPEPYVVASNGTLVEQSSDGTRHTFVFRPRDPLATYLATVAIARLAIQESVGPGGLPLRLYHPLDASEAELLAFARTSEILAFFSECFGPYPFECYGGVISYETLGGALECQTIPVYGRGCDEEVLAHEMAHQWFGDCVSPKNWRDLWLSEGFATFAEELWLEHAKGPEALEERARETYARLRERQVGPPSDPGVAKLFSGRVYQRGGWVLHMLRREVGDETFFKILRGWVADHHLGNGSTEEFVAHCSEVAGRDLASFFQGVLYAPVIPEVADYEPPRQGS